MSTLESLPTLEGEWRNKLLSGSVAQCIHVVCWTPVSEA